MSDVKNPSPAVKVAARGVRRKSLSVRVFTMEVTLTTSQRLEELPGARAPNPGRAGPLLSPARPLKDGQSQQCQPPDEVLVSIFT